MYRVFSETKLSIGDSVKFNAKNISGIRKEFFYSLAFQDSSHWQEIDNDIFTAKHHEMQLIKLDPMMNETFTISTS